MTVMIHLAGARAPVVPWSMIRGSLYFDDLIVCVFVSLWHRFSMKKSKSGIDLITSPRFDAGNASSLFSFKLTLLLGHEAYWIITFKWAITTPGFHDQILKISADQRMIDRRIGGIYFLLI
jgi:hypothetical protein